MTADQDVDDAINGVANGTYRPWAWVRGRARAVVGDVVKKTPFTKDLGNGVHVASTTSNLDHGVLSAEQLGWRYIDQFGVVWDLKDFMIVLIEQLNGSLGKDGVAALRTTGSQLRPWPVGFPGKPSFE